MVLMLRMMEGMQAKIDQSAAQIDQITAAMGLDDRGPGALCPPVGKVLGWPKRCKLALAFMWEHSYKGLKLAQLLGQLGVFLTSVLPLIHFITDALR